MSFTVAPPATTIGDPLYRQPFAFDYVVKFRSRRSPQS
jgi:hypothetical protein